LGGVLRAKTWSWRDPLDPARRIGGFAGAERRAGDARGMHRIARCL